MYLELIILHHKTLVFVQRCVHFQEALYRYPPEKESIHKNVKNL